MSPREALERLRNSIYIDLSCAEIADNFVKTVEEQDNAFQHESYPQPSLMKALEGFEKATESKPSNFADEPEKKVGEG